MNHKPYGSYEKYFKRLLDIVCSLAAIIVFSWLYIILIILGAIFMRGNPFFTQERPGKDEKIFKLLNSVPWIIEKIRMEICYQMRFV